MSVESQATRTSCHVSIAVLCQFQYRPPTAHLWSRPASDRSTSMADHRPRLPTQLPQPAVNISRGTPWHECGGGRPPTALGWRAAWRYEPTKLSSQYPRSLSMQNARMML